MATRYMVWGFRGTENSCVLGPLSGVKSLPLKRGEPHASIWPTDVTLRMDPDYPDDMALLDNVPNLESLIVASKPLETFLRSREIPRVEYLPVGIVNHKGRTEKAPYVIVSPVGSYDALDTARSGARVMRKTVMKVERLVVDENRIPEDAQLVRLSNFPKVTLVQRALAGAISEKGFSGTYWREYDEYGK